MILEKIRLKNFRCFHGETSIRFSKAIDRNVTIIYAENGFGKTTLLNALLWCFYDQTTPKFEMREHILNYHAKNAGHTEAWVEVRFEHNDMNYVAKRLFSVGSYSDRKFYVARIDAGSQIMIDPPDTFINTVIPSEMAKHFLFDGEHAEVVLGEDNQKSIKRAVRDILGCSLIETAIEDLRDVSNQFRRQIPKDAETSRKNLSCKHAELTNQIDEANEAIAKHNSDRERTVQQINDINEKLRNSEASKELQRNRDNLRKQEASVKKRLEEHADEVYRWLGEYGRYIVSKRITEEALSFLEESQQRGRIPSPYNEEFVKDVLAAEECICGTRLVPGSRESKKVASLLEKAANQTMRDRVFKVRARLTDLKNGRIKAPGHLINAERNLSDADDEYAEVEAKIAEIGDKLKDINVDDIAERERRRDELLGNLREIDRKIGSLENKVSEAEHDKEENEREMDKLDKQDKQTAIYAGRRELCETIRETLDAQLTREEVRAREVLRDGISRILKDTTHKVLKLSMTDDYVISLVGTDGKPLPKSSGENQLLGLAFTAALVEFANECKYGVKDDRLLTGTIAPLVLDSPFGQLDETYRATTAKFIPKMARQVVLLVSKSQGSEDVLDAIKPHLGAEYLLVRHNTDPRGERNQESRCLGGKEYTTVIFDSEYDETKIVEITSP